MVNRFRSGASSVSSSNAGRVFRGAPVAKQDITTDSSIDTNTRQLADVIEEQRKIQAELDALKQANIDNQFQGDGAIISRSEARRIQIRTAELGERFTALQEAREILESGRSFQDFSQVEEIVQQRGDSARDFQQRKISRGISSRRAREARKAAASRSTFQENDDGSFFVTDNKGITRAFTREGKEVPLQSAVEDGEAVLKGQIIKEQTTINQEQVDSLLNSAFVIENPTPIQEIAIKAQRDIIAKDAENRQSRADTFADSARFASQSFGPDVNEVIKGRFQQVGVGVTQQAIAVTEGVLTFAAKASVQKLDGRPLEVDFGRFNNRFGQFVRDIKATPISRTAKGISFAAVQGTIIGATVAASAPRAIAAIKAKSISLKATLGLFSPTKIRDFSSVTVTSTKGFKPNSPSLLDAVNTKASTQLTVKSIGTPKLETVNKQVFAERQFQIKQFTNVVNVKSGTLRFGSIDTTQTGFINIGVGARATQTGNKVSGNRLTFVRGSEVVLKGNKFVTKPFTVKGFEPFKTRIIDRTSIGKLDLVKTETSITPLGQTKPLKFQSISLNKAGTPFDVKQVTVQFLTFGKSSVTPFLSVGGTTTPKINDRFGVIGREIKLETPSSAGGGPAIEVPRSTETFSSSGFGDLNLVQGRFASFSPQGKIAPLSSPTLQVTQTISTTGPLATKTLTIPVIKSAQRSRQTQATLTLPRVQQSTAQIQNISQIQTQTPVQTQTTRTSQTTRTAQLQQLNQLQRLEQIQRTITSSPPPSVPITPTVTRNPAVFGTPFKLPRSRRSRVSVSPLFPVFARRQGRFFSVGAGRTRQEAVRIGARFTSQSLSAVFKVGGRGFGTLSTPRGFKQVTRGGQTLFIEQPKFRLDTPTERLQLKIERRRKRR